jgi:hypothetical protein
MKIIQAHEVLFLINFFFLLPSIFYAQTIFFNKHILVYNVAVITKRTDLFFLRRTHLFFCRTAEVRTLGPCKWEYSMHPIFHFFFHGVLHGAFERNFRVDTLTNFDNGRL